MGIGKQGWSARAAIAAAAMMSSATTFAADVASVSNPWVRATVPGQEIAGAYFDITAKVPAALIAAASPVAARAELHAMTLDGGVMKMRPLAKLDLPADQTVDRKSTRLNSSHIQKSRMPSSA